MADIVVTASAVLKTGTTRVVHEIAGDTITAGQTLYKEASTKKVRLGDSNSGTAEAKVCYGIALNDGADGQPMAVAIGGDVTFNAVLTAGTAYYMSETPGGIQPSADVATEDVVFVGHATSTTNLKVLIQNTGVTV